MLHNDNHTEKRILYFTQGNSDKVYNVHLISKEAGSYDVVAENGRRGSALRQSVKNKAPLDLAGIRPV